MTKRFIENQGFKINLNIIYQENERRLKLAKNGKESRGKRTVHLSITYFYITSLISRKEVEVKYCPTDKMIGDNYMSKPVLGTKF